MKIEKVNENQIRCTLTREDLADRHIKLSELAYGSEKAKGLFRDMMQQANYEFGFETNDMPLMVEAIPLPSESVVLLITKVEYPEELDTRFSRFTEGNEEDYAVENYKPEEKPQGADDILDLFNKIRKEHEKQEEKELAQSEGEVKTKTKSKTEEKAQNLRIMYRFTKIEIVERFAKKVSGFYQGTTDLYKLPKEGEYCLILSKDEHSPEEFNKVVNMASDFGESVSYTSSYHAYLMEHATPIIVGNALLTLNEL